MAKKCFKKNDFQTIKYKKFLLDFDDDENETVDWIETIEKEYFDCGCCENCLCDDNIKCANCGCDCNGDELDEDDYCYEDDNFSVNIIKSETNEKLVRITLQLNVMLNDKNEKINIDVDINSKTYLKIAEELYKIN
jgi:hypothetical protein